MAKVVDVVNRLLEDWSQPREPQYLVDAKLSMAMPEQCSAERPGSATLPDKLPEDLHEFWTNFASSVLFEDVNFGQWGLRILDVETSNRSTHALNRDRTRDAQFGDRVVGEFIGDLETLVVRCDARTPDFGHVLVALPAAPRDEWYTVAESLSSFLTTYASCDGQKYWEPHFRGKQMGASSSHEN